MKHLERDELPPRTRIYASRVGWVVVMLGDPDETFEEATSRAWRCHAGAPSDGEASDSPAHSAFWEQMSRRLFGA